MHKGMLHFGMVIFVLFVVVSPVQSQDTIQMQYDGYPVYGRIENGDTIIISNLKEATIHPQKQFDSKRERRRYTRLVHNVKKVYPYARIAGDLFRDVEINLTRMNTEKEQKEYIKKVEKELKDRYEEELTNLTITQGRILIKLVDRETQHTTYELVNELRGSFQAFLWQAIARIFGSNLKWTYDAYGEEQLIEEIILMIDYGMI